MGPGMFNRSIHPSIQPSSGRGQANKIQSHWESRSIPSAETCQGDIPWDTALDGSRQTRPSVGRERERVC